MLTARIAKVLWFNAGKLCDGGSILLDLIGHFVEVCTRKVMRMRVKLDADSLVCERGDLLFT